MKQSILLTVLGILLLVSAPFVADFFDTDVHLIESSERFAKTLDQKSNRTIKLIEQTQNEIHLKGSHQTQLLNSAYYESLFETEGIMLVVFRDNQLALWTNNAISPQNLREVASKGTEIHKFENGWYRIIYMTNGIDEYCGAIQIKKTFPYTNKYLDNGFRADFSQIGLEDIHINSVKGSVKLKASHQSFFLTFQAKAKQNTLRAFVFVLFSLAGGILLLISVFRYAQLLFGKESGLYKAIFISLLIIGLRYISIVSGWPSFVTAFGLFSPLVYASSSLFPSLFDFIINIAVIFTASLQFAKLDANPNGSVLKSWASFILGLVLLLVGSVWVNGLLKGLVTDSNIPFNINNITVLNGFSYLGIVGVGLLFYTYYKLASALIQYAKDARLEGIHALFVLVIATLILVTASHFYGVVDLIYVLWPTTLILALFYYQFYGFEQKVYRLGRIILGILFFAGISAHNFLKHTQTREHAQRQILSEKLAVDDDPVAEVIYSDVESRLVKNRGIQKVFRENDILTREILQDYVLSRYFTGYWSKYNIEMYTYNADSTVWGKMSSVRPRSFREIIQQVSTYGQASTQNPGLYYMYNSGDLVTYMAIMPLHYGLTDQPDGFFVFELSSKLFPQQLGFPSMLIDESSNSPSHSSDYASARYVNKSLINSRGEYPYQAHPGSFDHVEESPEYIKKRGYEHLVSRVDQNTILVISQPLKSPLNKVTTLSYLCAIFGIAYALAMLITHLITRKGPLSLNLNQKIQGLLVALTFTSLVFFAFATQYYIRKNYTEKNQRQISEKMQSVLIELEQKMGEEESLSFDMSDLLNRMLAQFSTIFFTDINVYNPDGYLLASSQMRMFNEGLISRKIHPEAFAHLKYLDQVEFIHEEKVGKMSYLSGYTPFYNSRNELLAYINLPYFAKQTELENEISSFLVAVINVFVLLFLLSILIGLYTSQWITAPLRTIRESLAAVELGKTNRLIGYSGSDEIGRLVQEYNRKVAELEHNAEILAQSERESAWREMAKQVAHEIKNPLTPMKLSVQHFERSFLKGEKIDADKVSRLTSNLVDQIDALTGIANAFSNFAQMPKAQTSVIDLVGLLKSAAELFEGFENIDLKLNLSLNKAEILADKEQMLRVFNNIIKNAVQAIEPNKRGLIQLLLEKDETGYLVTVADNGRGIAKEDYAKIFVPNFTTKTRGMGLGLALTKNIVEQSGGKIWFESELEKGTKLFVWLPVIE